MSYYDQPNINMIVRVYSCHLYVSLLIDSINAPLKRLLSPGSQGYRGTKPILLLSESICVLKIVVELLFKCTFGSEHRSVLAIGVVVHAAYEYHIIVRPKSETAVVLAK